MGSHRTLPGLGLELACHAACVSGLRCGVLWATMPQPTASDGERAPGRLDGVDVARGIAIALIVQGHTQRGLVSAGILLETPTLRFLDAWMYAFHVPVFFMAAGLFLPRAAGRGSRAFAAGRLRRLAYPYLVWAPLQLVIQSLASRYANNSESLAAIWRTLYLPPMQFWFVYALLLQSLFFGVLWALGVRRGVWWVLIGALMHYGVQLGLPLGTWGPLYSASDYLVYLGLGIALGGPGLLESIAAVKRWPSLAVGAAGFALMTALLALTRAPYPVACALAGIAGTLGLSQGLAGSRYGNAAAMLGRRSLEIYVAHTIAAAGVRVVLQKGLGVTDPGLHMVAGTGLGLAVPLLLAWFAERYEFPYLFEWPEPRRSGIVASEEASAAG